MRKVSKNISMSSTLDAFTQKGSFLVDNISQPLLFLTYFSCFKCTYIDYTVFP